MAEEARLESVYTPKAYPEFESRSLRRRRAAGIELAARLSINAGGGEPGVAASGFAEDGYSRREAAGADTRAAQAAGAGMGARAG